MAERDDRPDLPEPRGAARPGRARTGLRAYVTAGLAVAALGLALGGCGESKEQKAEKQICSAKADIKTKATSLESLPLAPASIEKAKTELTAISGDLKKINEAARDLAPSRKQEVTTATEQFSKQAGEATEQLKSTGSLGAAEAQLKAALQGLGNAYKSALEPVKCS